MTLARLGGRTFASLRHRDYRLYFAGSAVSFVGPWMQQIAAYWLVLELTESPVAVGALALVQTLPVTAFVAEGGTALAFSFAGVVALLVAGIGAAAVAGARNRRPVTVDV